jgi:hypothetical protein
MTTEEKKTTGYNTLSSQEQKALNDWIEAHFSPHQDKKDSLYLNINIQNGKVLILSDGSEWEVAPEDRSISSLWITPFPLEIKAEGSQDYPDTIFNLNNPSEKVRVKKLPTP